MTVRTHFRIVFRGIFNGTPEQWSYSTKWRRDIEEGGDATLEDIDEGAITTAVEAFHGDVMFQDVVRCTEWRAYVIGTDGKMEGDPLLVALDGDGANGTGTTRAYPTNVSLCVTTVADHRGPGRYGRFFLPGPHAQLGSDRLIATSWLDPVVTRCTDFLKDISDAIDIPASLNSAAMLNISDNATSAYQEVDHIKIGRVLDSISRRRNAMLEDYREGGQIDW
jgi:hypothetical protein